MLRVRLLTAAALVAIVIYTITYAPSPLPKLAALVVFTFLTGSEFIGLRWHTIDGFAHTEFPRPPMRKEYFGIGASYAMCLCIQFLGDRLLGPERGFSLVLGWVGLNLFIGAAFFYRRELDLEMGAQKLLNAMAGFAYIAFPAMLMLRLSELRYPQAPQGVALYFSLAVVFMGDTGAYFVGRFFGRRKLIPKVSPKKTVEGALGGLVASALTGVFIDVYFHLPFAAVIAAFIGLVGGVAGQVGDLFESALKRAANVKDSGNLLPGHGGMLDRVDAALFGVPLCYTMFLLTLP